MEFAEQKQLDSIYEEEKKQDEMLDRMSDELGNLQRLSNALQDATLVSISLIDEAAAKVDDTTSKMKNTTDQSRGLLGKINSNSTKLCSYLVCIMILIAIASVAYKVIQ